MKKLLSLLLAAMMIIYMAGSPGLGVWADDGELTPPGDDGISLTPGWPTGPNIQGDGAIVVEATTGSILYAKNIYDKFYPASTTKVLTTLVALENSNLNEVVTVSFAADNYVSKTSSRMGLVEGEQLTMEQALYGIMLESANEATYAVGEHVGGSIARFIKLMNAKAKALGCTRSHFANSHGLHDDDHYTCPYDLMLIAKAAIKNEDFARINATATYAMPATNKNDAKLLVNHHWFLNKTMKYDYCIGGKTGATTQAGYALVTYAKKDGMTLISVVMHAPTWNAVYTDSKTLLDYCFDNFKQYSMDDLGVAKSEFPSMFNKEIGLFDEGRGSVLSNAAGGIVILPAGISPEETTKTITYDYDAEIGKGENVIGSVTYSYEKRVVGKADIVYYNSEDTMTDSRFKAEWPAYMIPIEVAYTAEELAVAQKAGGRVSYDSDLNSVIDFDKNGPLFIGLGIGSFVLLLGVLVVLRRSYRK